MSVKIACDGEEKQKIVGKVAPIWPKDDNQKKTQEVEGEEKQEMKREGKVRRSRCEF